MEVLEFAGVELNDEQDGQVAITPVPDGQWEIVMMRKPGLDPERAAGFDEWARERVFVALTVGPESDGWYRRQSDGGWQITARTVEMPADPFL